MRHMETVVLEDIQSYLVCLEDENTGQVSFLLG